MFAVIKTGGKQYRVAPDDKLTIERLKAEPGEIVVFDEVLMVGGEGPLAVGTPNVAGASVAAAVVEWARGPKVIAFKKRRRKNSRRKRGHRQDLTVVQITEILTGGARPSRAAPVVAKATSEDIELIAGIGPTIRKKLVGAGIASWKQIAAWGEDDIAKYDEELALKGRIVREEWVEQAKELLAGKPPRAKVDKAKAGKDE